MYVMLLPFALWRTCQWVTPFAAGVVAFLLLGVENIGAFLETSDVLSLSVWGAQTAMQAMHLKRAGRIDPSLQLMR